MKTVLSAVAFQMLAFGALLAAESGPSSEPYNPVPVPKPQIYLTGQFAIEGASARPAARTSYLLYAAALDQFAIQKAQLLASEPVLAGLVHREFRDTLARFNEYPKFFTSKKWAPIVDAEAEAASLEAFVLSGYSGKLLPVIRAYVMELKAAANTKKDS